MAPHSSPGPPAGERLARLEAQLEQLVNATNRTHADLREHLAWQQRMHAAQEKRFGAVEREQERVRVHLKWMKAAWMAVQGTVIGWMGLK